MNEPSTKNRQATRTLLVVFAGLIAGTCLYLFADMSVASSLSPTAAAELASSRSASTGDGAVPLVNVKMEPYPRAEGLDFLTLVCGAPSTLQGDIDNGVGSGGNSWTDTRWFQGGSEEFNRVQKLIYDSQHPQNCSEKKIMQWVGAFEGFTAIGIGGQLSTLSLTLGLAIVRDKVLVVGDNSSQFTNCPQRSFECFLEPLSSCPQEPIHTRLQKRRRGWKTGDITAAHLEAIFSKLCERFGLASVIDLHMHLLAYIMRPRRQLCQKMLEVAQESFSLSTPSSWWSADLSVHLRTGDKHELGDELLSKFVLAMDKMFPSGPFHGRGLFSSDDFGAIEAFKHALGSHGATFEQVNPKFFLKLTGDDGAGTKREKNAALEINHRMRDDPNTVDMLEILLINMFLLANSQRLVAAFDSNWARILALMIKSTAARQHDVFSKPHPINFQDINSRLKSDEVDSIWVVKGGAWGIANNCLLLNDDDVDSFEHGSRPAECHMGLAADENDTTTNRTIRLSIMDKFPNRDSCFAYQKAGTSHRWRRNCASLDTTTFIFNGDFLVGSCR
eukprot:INCI14780.9.p1 GENE.INCI14780.9~~INCI14780.9.p1  ORF type:complete len:559 (+),score=79.80 INCI14780.9:148-1824(+)